MVPNSTTVPIKPSKININEKPMEIYQKSGCAVGYTNVTSESGSRCCVTCELGHVVKNHCNAVNDTICEPCQNGVTFSYVVDQRAVCKTCSKCPNNSLTLKPCTYQNDAVCVCKQDFYRHSDSGQCLPCSECRPGYGAMRECTRHTNTACKLCPNGTFSDVTSAKYGCRICTVCKDDQVVWQQCTDTKDTMCLKNTYSAKGRNIQGARTVPTRLSHAMHEPEQLTRTGHRVSRDNIDVIPIYCSLLGLVVVGLAIYVIIKHTRRVRSKRGKCRHVDEGEFGPGSQGDGGVYYEQQIVPLTGKSRYIELSLARRREIAGKLAKKNAGDWRKLALQLGYDKEKIAKLTTFTQAYNSNPAEFLFDEWARHEKSTISKLAKALHKINRQELSKLLYTDSINAELRPLHINPSHIEFRSLKSTIVL